MISLTLFERGESDDLKIDYIISKKVKKKNNLREEL